MGSSKKDRFRFHLMILLAAGLIVAALRGLLATNATTSFFMLLVTTASLQFASVATWCRAASTVRHNSATTCLSGIRRQERHNLP
jgi:hypothetical protein